MLFFVMGKPDSGGQWKKWMPLDEDSAPFRAILPAVKCQVCGRTWKSISRVPEVEVPLGSGLLKKLQESPVSPARFGALVAELRRELGIPESTNLPPGATLGKPVVTFRRGTGLPDFV